MNPVLEDGGYSVGRDSRRNRICITTKLLPQRHSRRKWPIVRSNVFKSKLTAVSSSSCTPLLRGGAYNLPFSGQEPIPISSSFRVSTLIGFRSAKNLNGFGWTTAHKEPPR